MTLDLANGVGLLGSVLMVVAYAYFNLAQALDVRLFNLLNLIGSTLLIGSLLVHVNFPSLALEIVWAAIAAFGLARALRRPVAR